MDDEEEMNLYIDGDNQKNKQNYPKINNNINNKRNKDMKILKNKKI